jgi:hypothetical protein
MLSPSAATDAGSALGRWQATVAWIVASTTVARTLARRAQLGAPLPGTLLRDAGRALIAPCACGLPGGIIPRLKTASSVLFYGQEGIMRVASAVCGLLALVCFPFHPPITGCLQDSMFLLLLVIAGVGILLGVISLWMPHPGAHRSVAIAGILACAVSPFVGRLFWPRDGPNDRMAIGDTRTVISAEAAYQSANSGYYGTLTCLTTPSSCIPGYTGPTFLDASFGGSTRISKKGYVRTWTEKASTAGPPGSVEAFCYQSRPAFPGKTGIFSLGGDASGDVGRTDAMTDCCDLSGHLNAKTCPPLR